MTQIITNKVSEYQLPAPQWELIENDVTKTFMDWNTVSWSDWWVRVPLVNQKVIDDWELFVEFGRIKRTYVRDLPPNSSKERGSKINWYSSWVNQSVETMWYSWWHHTYNDLPLLVDRPNMFPVTNQWYRTPALPRNAFYRMVDSRYYNWDNFSWSDPRIVWPQPHMTSAKIRKMATNVIQTWTNIGRQLPTNQLKDLTQQWSEWYARLVVKKDGKVVQQWPHSEPLFVEFTWWPIAWNEFYRQYQEDTSWTPRQAKITIWHKYKK